MVMSENNEHEFDDDEEETEESPESETPVTEGASTGYAAGVDMDQVLASMGQALTAEPEELEAMNYDLDGDKHLGDASEEKPAEPAAPSKLSAFSKF